MGKIVGIDLGTTTSEIAYLKNGKPEIIKNGYSSMTPSIVGLGKNMEVLVGMPAKNQLVSARERTAAEVKRKMGTGESVIMSGKRFTPVEISALILKELKRVGENYLQEEITEAVITVPANFNDAQRQATKEAGEKAGFIVERIINEPTAAALAFGVDHMDQEGKILVYDLGGGTFDVTVLDMIEGALDVLASRGINQLGGKDFDEKIISFILDELRSQYDIDCGKDLKAMARIKEEAEKAKVNLSDVNQTAINLPYIALKNNTPVFFETELTREKYETLIAEYVERTMATVYEAIAAAKIKIGDIDIVIAVGGSSRTPLVMKELKKVFGDKIRGGINPDEAVALGAAVQAGIKSGELAGAGNIVIFDVCNHSLGIDVTRVNNQGEKVPGYYDRLILRDTHLPFARTETYVTVDDYQTALKVVIYQGEDNLVVNNIKLGELYVEDIPSNKAGEEKVDVTFRYDINGILQVSAKILSTDREVSTKINMYQYDAPKNEPDTQMSDLEWENYSLAGEIKTTILLYQSRRCGLPEQTRKKADELMEQLKKAVIENDTKKLEELDDHLTAVLFEY